MQAAVSDFMVAPSLVDNHILQQPHYNFNGGVVSKSHKDGDADRSTCVPAISRAGVMRLVEAY
jgi:hypothetical protein